MVDHDLGLALRGKVEAYGTTRLAELEPYLAPAVAFMPASKTAETMLRAEHVHHLLANSPLQQGFGGSAIASPAFLGARRHDGVRKLEQVCFTRAVLTDDDVETLGKA